MAPSLKGIPPHVFDFEIPCLLLRSGDRPCLRLVVHLFLRSGDKLRVIQIPHLKPLYSC